MSLAQKPKVRRCVCCDSSRKVVKHHWCGENHCAWFIGPLCEDCHQLLHTRATQAKIDLRNTNDPIMRIQQGLSMLTIGEWMLLEQLKREREKEVQPQRGEQS